jgi:hypothetical protein
MHEIHTRPFDYEQAREHIYRSGYSMTVRLDESQGGWSDDRVLRWFDRFGPSVRDDATHTCPWDVTAGGVRSGS